MDNEAYKSGKKSFPHIQVLFFSCPLVFVHTKNYYVKVYSWSFGFILFFETGLCSVNLHVDFSWKVMLLASMWKNFNIVFRIICKFRGQLPNNEVVPILNNFNDAGVIYFVNHFKCDL